MEAHHGSAYVEDAPGGGALFCLTFPSDTAHKAPAAQRQPEP